MVEKPNIVDVLNQILNIEYASILYYPQLAAQISGKEAAEAISQLAEESKHHRDRDIELVKTFGGEPAREEETHIEGNDIMTVLQQMLEMEKLAGWLYRQASGLTDDAETKKSFLREAAVERNHAAIVEEVLMKLPA